MNSPFNQSKIADSHLMVVGCGALGNEVLKNLVLMGAEHLTVVDFDRVEIGNLSRSILFTREDAEAGRYKVDVVASRLRQMNSRLDIQTIQGDIAYDVGLGLIRQMDVVIGCVDNRWARYCINRHCMRCGISWVDGAIDMLEGTVRVFEPGRNCYACNLGPKGLGDLARRMPCAGMIRHDEEKGKAPTTSLMASVIGAVQVQEALKLLHTDELTRGGMTSLCGRMFYYEGQHLTTRMVDFEAYDDDCAVHECWNPVRKLPIGRQTMVAELLETLRDEYRCNQVTVCLHDDCFVDYVVGRENNICKEVMKPGRAVASFVEQDETLSGIPLSGMYQHEYRTIDQTFPYQSLTLGQLGIPERDVLHIITDSGNIYIEIE